jgi:CheY-like chemotaxis protein
VIDDDRTVREVLADVLTFCGHTVTMAASGEAGIAAFERERHDVVLTDLLMPGLTGWDVITRVRDVDPGVPVLMVSGALGTADLERAAALGVQVLHKPVRLEQLQRAVHRMAPRERAAAAPADR